MAAVVTRITIDNYLDLLKECFIEAQGKYAFEPWHPEDLYANLSILMHPLALGLANGKQHIKLDDTFWERDSKEDPL